MLLNPKSTALSNHYRPSASLIIAVRDEARDCYGYDFRVLLFKRTLPTAYAHDHCVFPGGVFEAASDECSAWLEHYKHMGVTKAQLEKLCVHSGKRPPLLTDGQQFPRDISIRITAIRETFEEVGVFLCRDRDSISKQSNDSSLDVATGHFREDFDRAKWQNRVHEDPMQFLKLCKYLQVVPDLWSLYEWSVWRSPTTASKKYDTVFYFVALDQRPDLLLEHSEVEIELLHSPSCLLSKFAEKSIWLPPIQFYELSRLTQVHDWVKLNEFVYNRSNKGSTVLMPVYYRCKEGLVGALSGDDFYPQNPELFTETVEAVSSINEFRQRAKNLHRFIIRDMYDMTIELNITPIDSHLSPSPIRSKL